MTSRLPESVVQFTTQPQTVTNACTTAHLNDPISLISHELRTPLNSIRGALGLLQHGKLDACSQEGQAILSIALKNIDRLIRLAQAIEQEDIPLMTVWSTDALEQLRLELDLEKAWERQEFQIFYQPIVCLKTRKITGFEALARWQHPYRGFVSPSVFIPLAEKLNLIHQLDIWILQQACRQLRRWQQQFPAAAPLSMSVNLSALQLSQPDLITQVQQILQETEIVPRSLILEITESTIIENPTTDITVLEDLRALGVQIAIDDFGTGYSSLSRLQSLPITILKIDRSFVCNQQWEMIEGITQLVSQLGPEVILEGVETEEEFNALAAIGCQKAQGYFFSHPLNSQAAERLLSNSLSDKQRETDAGFVGQI